MKNSNVLLRGTAVKMTDGTTLRIPTIPFTDVGFQLAEKMDNLNTEGSSNGEVMRRMLDICLLGARLNYSEMTEERLASMLDLEVAGRILAALRGEEVNE